MNKEERKLVEDYLAGEAVEMDLLQACEKNPDLVEELREDAAFERILRHTYVAKSEESFLKSVEQGIGYVGTETSNDSRGKLSYIGWAMAACIPLAFVLLVTFSDLFQSNKIGTVSKVVAVNYEETRVVEGNRVAVGEYQLSQGYAEITLDSGVVLLLEAPVRLQFRSLERIELSEGNLVARVPPQATGFTVDTPSSRIVDLGTEFGVRVEKSGESQVHVLDGEVKVRASETEDFELIVENQARGFDLQQQVAIVESQPRRFMRTLPGKSAENPDYLHWSMDEDSEVEITCTGPGINGVSYPAKKRSIDGTGVGPDFIEGKFGRGIYFDGETSWLETEYPGVGGSKPRTIAFWVKVPVDFSDNEGFGMLSWGLPDVLSAWQISANPLEVSGPLGRIRIGTNQGEIVGTTDLRTDAWHHVAVVLFGGESADLSTHVLIYIDGELEGSAFKSIAEVDTDLDHPKSKPLIMGRNIGFSNPRNELQVRRFFRGGLDEVFIFDSALDQKSIRQLMGQNRLVSDSE